MISAYIPRGKKRKSQANLQEAASKYMTNGVYDQRKSDMLASLQKEKVEEKQAIQAKRRKELNEWNLVYDRIYNLFDTTMVSNEAPQLVQSFMTTGKR